jgi:hypothetical protein
MPHVGRGIAELMRYVHLSCYWQLVRQPPRWITESIRVFLREEPYAGCRDIDRALSPPAGAPGQLNPPRLYKGQHERPREEVSKRGLRQSPFQQDWHFHRDLHFDRCCREHCASPCADDGGQPGVAARLGSIFHLNPLLASQFLDPLIHRWQMAPLTTEGEFVGHYQAA